MSLKLCTLNVRGTSDATKREALCCWMTKHNIDILALQETYVTVESSQRWQHQFANHDIYHSYGTNHSRAVSIVVDKSCQTNWQYALEKVDVNGRYVVLKIIGEYEVCLAAIYAPVSYTERETFLTDLNQELRQYDNHIICGDFSCVIDPKKDKISSSLSQPRTASINTMQKFIAEFNLEDIYRKGTQIFQVSHGCNNTVVWQKGSICFWFLKTLVMIYVTFLLLQLPSVITAAL